MRRLLPLVLTIVTPVLVLTQEPAMAHGDEVQLEVVESTPDDTGSAVTYRVALTYVNDGDGIDGASITAIGTSDTASTSPVTLAPAGEPGVYEGTITFPDPGDWIVRFGTSDPEASASIGFTVEEPAPATTAVPASTVTGPPPTSSPSEPQLADEETDDSGPPIGLIVGLVVTGLAVVAVAVVLIVQRRRTEA